MLKFVKHMLVVASIATTSFLAQDIALAGGGFSTSCPGYELDHSSDGWDLDATCRTENQSLVYNHLPLNPHIANDDGKLVWRKNGGFSSSVYNCGLTGATLLCFAVKRDGHFDLAYINLDDEIANYNGHLTVLDGF